MGYSYKAKTSVGATLRLRGENEPPASPPREGENEPAVLAVYEERTLEGTRVMIVSRNTT